MNASLQALMIVLALAGETPAKDAAPVDFARDVQPILAKHCLACHGEKTGRKGDLDLRTAAGAWHGGQSGPAVVAGSAEKSPLWTMLEDGSMPPEGKPRLSDAERATLKGWITTHKPSGDEAAARPLSDEDKSYWAFQKLKRPAVPAVEAGDRVRTPIDTFILAKLEGHMAGRMTLSPDASRAALLRRVTFDLTGLPPTPAELDEFLADSSSSAYERLVDRLLASPHYGERWARHWLDAAGYADTVKTDNDINGSTVREGMWRYRDYVVRSLNADKPYDQFVREQLAGDELTGLCGLGMLSPEAITPEIAELLTATGLLRTSVDGTNNFERNRPLERHEVLYDTMENLTSNLLGLTVSCARCHDHKFDPISHRDYYGLMACLTPSYNPENWIQPQQRHVSLSTAADLAEMEQTNKELDKQANELGGRLSKIRRPVEQRLHEMKLAALPEPIRDDVRAALKIESGKRTEVQKYLVERFEAALRPTNEEIQQAIPADEQSLAAELDHKIEDLRARKRNPEKIQALFEVGSLPATRLFRRGNFETPGPEIAPAIPRVLRDEDRPAEANPFAEVDRFTNGQSGRRLALAKALTEPGSRAAGLLARVYVNRIWQHHFGRGIVATPGNLGRSGAKPSHPELLEFLAADFVEGGWTLKRLHKQIVMSSVYRQASAPSSPLAREHDPQNELLSRMPLRRLESEGIRDAILAVSGRLDRTLGGPAVQVEGRPDGLVVVASKGQATPTSGNRRSLYVLARRNFNLSILSVFDQPLMGTNCTKRNQSAVVSQSLALLNDAFVIGESEHFARRVSEAASEPRGQVRAAFRIALAREPSPAELDWSLALVERQKSLASLCQMLLCTNEFLYVE